MKLKRIISLLLVVCTVISASAMLFSCGPAEEKEEKQTDSTGRVIGGTDASGDRVHYVPKMDFEGETFNSLNYQVNTAAYYYFTDEETSGDPVKEALWQREEMIEEHLNCDLTYTVGGNPEYVHAVLYDQILSDLDDFQQVLTHPIYGVKELVLEGYAYDFAALPHVDLTSEWWDLEDMDALRLGDSYSYGRSDFMISAPHAFVFNKTLIDDLNLESPYDLVKGGTWTIDKMMEMSYAAIRDVNNDGRMSGIDDYFGLSLSEISKFNSFLVACDQPISVRDEAGILHLALNTEKTVKIVEKFADMRMTRGAIYVGADKMLEFGVNHEQLFGEGRSLFVMHDLSILEKFRYYDVNYGIVPYPKYDEMQKEYRSMDWGPMWMVPMLIRNPELVGAVVELYSFYSADTIVPAYYDKVLEGKLAQDMESRRMLEIIFESVSFEPVNNYLGFSGSAGDLVFVIGGLSINMGSKNFASFYAAREEYAQAEITSLQYTVRFKEAEMKQQKEQLEKET